MKDWRRSPEPAGMMGIKEATYEVQGKWGQPDELSSDVDPAAPLRSSARPGPDRGSRLRPSLYAMCLRVILRNIASVQDLGEMPYRNAAPILEECRIDQLITLEEASPHLLEHTDEIWKRNCLRDFLELRKTYSLHPASGGAAAKEPKSWRKLYFRTQGEIEQAKLEAAQRIKHKYALHRAEKEAKKLVVSDRSLMPKPRHAARRFGSAATATKGQSLLNKARSSSVARAKLTAPRNGRSIAGFVAHGRSKAVGIEIAPQAAGIEVRTPTRPMVAPRRVTAGANEGLAKMKQFSKPLPGTEAANEQAKASSARKPPAKSHVDEAKVTPETVAAAAANTGLPRLKPREVAAAPPLSPCQTPSSASSMAAGARSGTSSSASPRRETSTRPTPPEPARTERRKLDFFGAAKPSSARASPIGRAPGSVKTASSGGSSSSKAGAVGASVSPAKRARDDDQRLRDTHTAPTTKAAAARKMPRPQSPIPSHRAQR